MTTVPVVVDSLPVVVAGSARKIVDKPTWRSGVSRLGFRAEMAPITIDPAVVEQAEGLRNGFAFVTEAGIRFVQQTVKWGRFALSVSGSEVALRFDLDVKKAARLDMGSLAPGLCVELAANARTVNGTTKGEMLYIDEVWRFWWPRPFAAGEWEWPAPDRAIDLRKILH